MYELIPINENDYYIDCPSKIGVVKISDREVILIDSGSDKDAAKKVLKVLDAQGWEPKAIYVTHSHADHIGGNHLIQERRNCAIYASGLEAVYSDFPLLEPIGLYGGLPFKELQNKFLMAQESRVQPLNETSLPEGWRLLPLSGHSFQMVGFLTKNGTAYIADSVSSEETLSKYGIVYLWDPQEAVASLEYLKTVSARCFVPAHAAPTEAIGPLADRNIEAITAVQENILRCCETGKNFEELLRLLFEQYSMTMNLRQYILIGSTVRSYLSSLKTQGKIDFHFDGAQMIWQTVSSD